MKISKITHCNEVRIRVDFPYNAASTTLLRQIQGTQWSKTLKCWHIPYTKEAFAQLKAMFPDVEYETTTPRKETSEPRAFIVEEKTTIENKKTELQKKIELNRKTNSDNKSDISIEITERHIYIKIPKNDVDIAFIRSFKFAFWDSKNYCWCVPNYKATTEKIKAYFSSRNPIVTELSSTLNAEKKSTQPTFTATQLLVINLSDKLFKVYFSYNKNLILAIKKTPFAQWNDTGHYWSIPYSEKYLSDIKRISEEFSLEFIYLIENKPKIKPRTSRHDIENFRECPPEYINKLTEMRYSRNTIDTYKHMFEEFINHFPDNEIKDITDEMIVAFLRYLVNERNISTSYQNQSINAIHPVGLFKN